MFGLEVCLWGVNDIDSNGFTKMLWNYYFYDGMGHTALKLTLPCNPQTHAWIEQYCSSISPYSQTAIPWKKTQTTITSRVEGQFCPKQVPCYEIYFSWWPDGFAKEKHDRISQLSAKKSQWSTKGKELLGLSPEESEKIPIPAGKIGKYLNRIMPKLCAWETDMNMPCVSTAHFGARHEPFHEATNLHESIELQRQEILEFKECEFSALLKKPAMDFTEDDHKLFLEKKTELKNKIAVFRAQVSSLKELLKCNGELLGVEPCHRVTLPIDMDEHGQSKVGVNVEELLKQINHFVVDYEFDIKWLNCSHAVRYLLLAGLEGPDCEKTREKLGVYQQLPSLWDNPSRMLQFSQRLQKSFIEASLEPNPQAPETVFKSSSMSEEGQKTVNRIKF